MDSTDSDERERDRQLLQDLETLYKERQEILAGTSPEVSTALLRLKRQFEHRMHLAKDYRDYQVANLRASHEVARRQAWNEYENGKKGLRRSILDTNIDLRKRLETIRTGGKFHTWIYAYFHLLALRLLLRENKGDTLFKRNENRVF